VTIHAGCGEDANSPSRHRGWTRCQVARALERLRQTGRPDGFLPSAGGVPSPEGNRGSHGRVRRDMVGIERVVELADVERAVAALPRRHRQAITLYFLSGSAPTQGEVARAMGLSRQRVGELVRESKEMIADALVPVEM